MLVTRVFSSLTPEASWGAGELVDCPPTSSLPLSIWQRRILKIAPWRSSYFVRGTWVLVFFICAFPSWIVKPFQICKSFHILTTLVLETFISQLSFWFYFSPTTLSFLILSAQPAHLFSVTAHGMRRRFRIMGGIPAGPLLGRRLTEIQALPSPTLFRYS